MSQIQQINSKSQIGGNSYDFLKFLMALLIVAIHSRAFYGPWFKEWVKPLLDIAVPVFFILSSMFYH